MVSGIGHLTNVLNNRHLNNLLSDVLDFKLDKTGYLSALPYLAMTLVVQSSGHLADYLRAKKIMTTTQVCFQFIFVIVLTATDFLPSGI